MALAHRGVELALVTGNLEPIGRAKVAAAGLGHHFGPGGGPSAAIAFKNWNVCSAALKSGAIGFAESYIAGDWTTPHLTDLLKLFIANRQQVEGVIYGTWAGRLLYRIKHLLNRNTKANSQKNIHAHYDLGNAFYELWLDDTITCLSAKFDSGHWPKWPPPNLAPRSPV